MRELDLSHNLLLTVSPLVLASLPPSLAVLDLTENPWQCLSSLAWLYSWSLGLARPVQAQLRSPQLTCQVPNSHQTAPLLAVVENYSRLVGPLCPSPCDCQFFHFAVPQQSQPGTASQPAYTVIVNCSDQGMSAFPALPAHTVVLDLSHNNITNAAYSGLDIHGQNYQEVAALFLSYNNLTYVHSKLLSLKPYRGFTADHNQISLISYDLSQLLQSFKDNEIRLGGNRWRCECEAEITNTVSYPRVRSGHESYFLAFLDFVDVNHL